MPLSAHANTGNSRSLDKIYTQFIETTAAELDEIYMQLASSPDVEEVSYDTLTVPTYRPMTHIYVMESSGHQLILKRFLHGMLPPARTL